MRRPPQRKSLLVPLFASLLACAAVLPVACATATDDFGDNGAASTTGLITSWHAVAAAVTSSNAGSGAGGAMGNGAGGAMGSGAGGAGGQAGAQSTADSSAESGSAQASAQQAAASSTSSGGGTCDGTGDCQTCVDCTTGMGGPCEQAYYDCFLDDPCFLLADCLSYCGPNDNACVDDCANSYSAGIPLYNALGECVVCQNCYSDCDGANSGC